VRHVAFTGAVADSDVFVTLSPLRKGEAYRHMCA
jgi:hypothetical protein